MRIVLIGANGSVGTEVALRLAARPDIDLVPVSRTRGGSVVLRHKGVRCLHADVSDHAVAKAAFAGADLVASLALPQGDPARARDDNRRLLDSIVGAAPGNAALVFFSTLAVEGEYSVETQRFAPTQYGRSKKWAEAHLLAQAGRHGRRAWVIRLGHVAGALQPLSRMLQEQAARGTVQVIEGERPSNVVHTVMLAELLASLAGGAGAGPGRYDLVNSPNWTWRQVYEHEAQCAGMAAGALDIASIGAAPEPRRVGGTARRLVGTATRSKLVARTAPRVLAHLPRRFEEKVRVTYMRQLVQRSIAGRKAGPPLNPALYWPPLGRSMFPGMAPTTELLGRWPLLEGAPSWPADLELTAGA